jgi:hypothetical protein
MSGTFQLLKCAIMKICTSIIGAEYQAMTKSIQPRHKGHWIRRLIYLAGALLSLPAMGYVIQFVSDITGLTSWSTSHGPYFILNEYTGPGVMANFLVILLFIGICMTFIFNAFSVTEELPID